MSAKEIDFRYMPPHIADEIYAVAIECAKQALACYGHNDEKSAQVADEAADYTFIGAHGLNCSWLSDGNDADNFDIVSAMETDEIAERVGEGAEMVGITMVEYVVRAINNQFIQDSIAKAEQDGLLVWNGEYRDRKPVFVHADAFRKMVN